MNQFTAAAFRVLCTITIATIAGTAIAQSPEAPAGFRGDGTGSYANTSPPTRWSESTNVVWFTPTQQWSNACPILVGDKIFICEEQTTLVCIDKATGKVLWRKDNGYDQLPADAFATMDPVEKKQLEDKLDELRSEQQKVNEKYKDDRRNPAYRRESHSIRNNMKNIEAKLTNADPNAMPRTHGTNGYSSPTPISDGKHVFVQYGTGVVAAYDLDGNRKWITLIDKLAHPWGNCNSPLLIDGMLVVHHASHLRGLDPADGSTKWRASSETHWGSPMAMEVGGQSLVAFADGQVLRAKDGKPVATGLNSLKYNSCLVIGTKIYFLQESSTAHSFTADGDNIKEERIWQATLTGKRYYASPLLVDGLLYAVNQSGYMHVMEASTGNVLYEKELSSLGRGTAYPSPVHAGNYIYINNDNGTTLVIKPGKEYKEVAVNQMSDFRATPVFEGDRMYLRTHKGLYCISEQSQASTAE